MERIRDLLQAWRRLGVPVALAIVVAASLQLLLAWFAFSSYSPTVFDGYLAVLVPPDGASESLDSYLAETYPD